MNEGSIVELLHVSTISAPVFIFQWQFDEAQMTADNVAMPSTQAQWNFIHHQGRNTRRTLAQAAAVFSPSCISHTVLTKPSWAQVTVAGTSLPDALQCWASQPQPGEPLQRDTEDTHSLVQNDGPAPAQEPGPGPAPATVNANMLKALNHFTASRLRHGAAATVQDNRTNKRMRKRDRRQRARRRQCKHGDTLEDRIRCAQEESRAQLRRARPEARRGNRDLVRSLDKRQEGQEQDQEARRRRQRRQRRRQRSEGHVARGRQLTRDERRRRRRAERRRLKQAVKARRRRDKQLRSLQQRSIQMRPQPATCPQRHVDTCSWPQCNRSCPKLHNPLTGD